MKHYYRDVPGLGNVALSRHAQERAVEERVTDQQVEQALWHGNDTPDADAIWREHAGLRLVIVEPKENRGARLMVTMYRVQRMAKAR